MGGNISRLSFGKRRERKLDKAIGLKTLSLGLRQTMEDSFWQKERKEASQNDWIEDCVPLTMEDSYIHQVRNSDIR